MTMTRVTVPLRALPALATAADAPSEAESLLSRLRAGDALAVGEAYEAHHAHVRAFARRLLGDEAAAEDLVQDAFVALPRAIARFDGRSSLRTFIVGIAVNHARHHVRAATRRRAAMGKLAVEPPAPIADPEGDAQRAELARLLWRALDALPIEQRVAFVVCDVEERTSVEASAILGAPEATVRTRLFHARRKLREWLAREGAR